MIERYNFRKRAQGNGEQVKQYVAALQQLASTCKFGGLKDELIRDQLIKKTSTPRIRERLLMENDDLTLEKAVTVVQNVEAALLDSKTLS